MTGVGWQELLAVAGGGALGASSRYLLGKLVQAWAAVPFPVGTLTVNVAGCLLFGLLFALLHPQGASSIRLQLFLTTGLLGGFTTFSTFSQETAELALSGRGGAASAYAALSLLLCLGATFAGGWLARMLAS